MGDLKPGWYPDPDMPDVRRYYDGEDFTEHVAPISSSPSVWTGARAVALGILIAVGVLALLGALFGAGSILLSEPVNCVEQILEYDAGERFTLDESCR